MGRVGPALIRRSGKELKIASPYCSSSTWKAALKWRAIRAVGRPVRLVDAAGAVAADVELLQGDDVRRRAAITSATRPTSSRRSAHATMDVVGEDTHRPRRYRERRRTLASAASTSARASPKPACQSAGAIAWERKHVVEAVWPGGERETGRLQYEPPKLIFRGSARRVFDGGESGVSPRRRPRPCPSPTGRGSGCRRRRRAGPRRSGIPRAGSTSWA